MAKQTSSESGESLTLLDKIVSEGRMAKDESQKAYARDLLAEFVDQIIAPGDTMGGDVVEAINARIAAIDELISEQLNEVLHAKPFQELESTWRGLHYFVMNTETSTRLKIRVLNSTKK